MTSVAIAADDCCIEAETETELVVAAAAVVAAAVVVVAVAFVAVAVELEDVADAPSIAAVEEGIAVPELPSCNTR